LAAAAVATPAAAVAAVAAAKWPGGHGPGSR